MHSGITPDRNRRLCGVLVPGIKSSLARQASLLLSGPSIPMDVFLNFSPPCPVHTGLRLISHADGVTLQYPQTHLAPPHLQAFIPVHCFSYHKSSLLDFCLIDFGFWWSQWYWGATPILVNHIVPKTEHRTSCMQSMCSRELPFQPKSLLSLSSWWKFVLLFRF